MDGKDSCASSCLCYSWVCEKKHDARDSQIPSISRSPELMVSLQRSNDQKLNFEKFLAKKFACDDIHREFLLAKDLTRVDNYLRNRSIIEKNFSDSKFSGISKDNIEFLNRIEQCSLCQRTGELHSRKYSLPAYINKENTVQSGISQRNRCSSERHFERTSSSRYRKNRFPRISYNLANDAYAVTTCRERPIYPSLPFSPFCSPTCSPGFRRQNRRFQFESSSTPINQYQLLWEIGRGSFGVVKLAYNEDDKNFYAMKILSTKKLMHRAGLYGRMPPPREGKKLKSTPLEQIYREIAILKKLNHPNVIQLFDVLNDPESDNLYMVFQLVQNGPVIQLPTSDPLSEVKSWQFFRDIVMGIEYLHYQKIIHRDIKPSNLLLNDQDRIQISDFGVCNQFEGVDAFLSDTCGTPAFAAPEALTGSKTQYSGKALDIWQMGISLYSFVFGHVPYDDSNILALYSRIKSEPLVFPPRRFISQSLKDLLHRMLEKDPNRRIKLADIKTHSWITKDDLCPLLEESENCTKIEVTDEEINNCMSTVPKLDTLVLIKSMLKKHSFCHPFKDTADSRKDT